MRLLRALTATTVVAGATPRPILYAAAAGAVGGAIGGSPGVGAAAGAASGVVWSLFSSLFGWMQPSRPSDAYARYVDMCLADRGYQGAGWK